MNKYKILIVSGCDKKQQVFGDISAEITKNYSNKHGYDFKYYVGDDFYFIPGLGIDSLEQQDKKKQFEPKRAHNWNKVSIVACNIENYDYILWLDSDAFILQNEISLEDIFEIEKNKNKEFFICPDAESLNMGVFLIKNTINMQYLLRHWIQMGINKNKYYTTGFSSGESICFYEQAAFSELYYKNWNNLMVLTEIMPAKKINAHLQKQFWRGPFLNYLQFDSNSFILHLAGLSFDERVKISKAILENKFEVDKI